MSDPVFSVVVPCRNERAALERCLDALLAQDVARERYEVIVVDGGSTDGSRDVATARGVRVLQDGATGPSGARNVGIRAARGEIVAFTDADCIPERDWLARLAEAFADPQAAAGVAGSLRMTTRTLLGRLEDLEARAYYRGFITSNVAYRRDVLLEVGGFDESLACAEDYDLAWRVMDRDHRVVHDPRPVVVHDPPEISGSLARYLRKHYWYAKSDVPASLRALQRAARRNETTPGSSSALIGVATAARDAALAALAVVGLRARPAAALGLAATGALSARRVVKAARALGAPMRDAPLFAAVVAARTLARGFGTIAGVASLARPSKRALVRLPSSATMGPASAPALALVARRGARSARGAS